jgi:hypothetical protein
LRYEPADDALWYRLSARIRDGINSAPPSVADLLTRWLRPMIVGFSALIIAGVMTLAVVPLEEEVQADNAQISVAGDSYSVGY